MFDGFLCIIKLLLVRTERVCDKIKIGFLTQRYQTTKPIPLNTEHDFMYCSTIVYVGKIERYLIFQRERKSIASLFAPCPSLFVICNQCGSFDHRGFYYFHACMSFSSQVVIGKEESVASHLATLHITYEACNIQRLLSEATNFDGVFTSNK